MNHRLQIDGEDVEFPADTEIQELKQKVGWPEEHIVTYDDGGDWATIGDNRTIKDIPEGAAVSTTPDKNEMFG